MPFHIQSILGRFLTRGVNTERARELTRLVADDSLYPALDIVERYARRAAVRSWLTGMPGGVLSVPLGLLDAQGSVGARLEMAVALHLSVDDAFLEQNDWRTTVLNTAYSLDLEATLEGPALASAEFLVGARTAAATLLREVVVQRGLRFVATRLGPRLLPIAGGFVGGGLTYAWMLREGGRMMNAAGAGAADREMLARYRMDETLDAVDVDSVEVKELQLASREV